jgi:hypothetical protein
LASSAEESARAWRELLDHVVGLDESFATGRDALVGARATVEGYRYLATVLGLALDIFVHADPARPTFVDINAPDRPDLCWGGDNTDASYMFCAIDPGRQYRITGRPGDSIYFSVTVYNQPEPGLWSNRIIGTVNDVDLDLADDGSFELRLGPSRPDGWSGPFIELAPDAAHVVTRDYQPTYSADTRTTFSIEAMDPPATFVERDTDLAAGLAAAKRWIDQQFTFLPLAVGAPPDESDFGEGHNTGGDANTFADPYRVPEQNFGWSAGDACYGLGTFQLAEDEALVITHRPPECRFWNLNLWNQFMAKFRHEYERVSINGATAVPNSDGTVTTVVSLRALAHPNAISTEGHGSGMMAFRWFLAETVPDRPTVEIVPVGSAPIDVT